MSTLIGVEVRRLLSRRVVRLLFVLAVVGILVAGIIVFLRSSTESRSAVLADDPFLLQEVERCERGEFQQGVPAGDTKPTSTPTRDQCMDLIGVQDPAFHLTDLDEILVGTSVPLIIVAWVIGATAIGAEWQKGTLQTMLTWEPRRLRLIAAKILACGIVAAIGFIVLQVFLGIALWPAATFRGTTAGADSEWLATVGGVLARGGAVAVFAAVVGFSIATVGRNTAAALGVGFLYISVIEGLVRGLRPQLVPWLVADNAAIFITAQPESLAIVGRSTAEAAFLLLTYALILCFAAAAFFKVRDVT